MPAKELITRPLNAIDVIAGRGKNIVTGFWKRGMKDETTDYIRCADSCHRNGAGIGVCLLEGRAAGIKG
jgi:hypothetical protein